MMRVLGVGLLAVASVALSASVPVAAAPPDHVDDADTPSARAGEVEFLFDCSSVPWPCTGANSARRWQLFDVRCTGDDCKWNWDERVEPNKTHRVFGTEYHRMFFTSDGVHDNINDFSMSWDRPRADQFELSVIYQCNRYKFLCEGPEAWQLYSCQDSPGGDCEWVYDTELTGNAIGVWIIRPLGDGVGQ